MLKKIVVSFIALIGAASAEGEEKWSHAELHYNVPG
jgi:hypothetical protein